MMYTCSKFNRRPGS